VQAYFDQTQRFGPESGGGGGFVLHTYDLQMQQNIEVASNQRIIWGGGERLNGYSITNQTELLFEPPRRNLTLADAFVQDTVSVGTALSLTAGLKMEDDPYWGWTPLPDARATWSLSDRATLWAAASKAIRSPTPFDVDVVEKLGSSVYLTGNSGFRPERVYAYEAGTRMETSKTLSLSFAAFYNDYDYLRTVELSAGPQFLPLYWGNSMKGDTYGAEGWANWQAAGWWRLSPGFTVLREQLRFRPGSSGLLGTTEAGDDPSSHADLTSSMDLSHRVSLDATLRYVGALPSPALPHYTELNGRIGWRPRDSLELSVNGLNLLHARHFEFPASQGGEGIYRSVQGEIRWKY
jgi:iron complex outermembrane receptor protein